MNTIQLNVGLENNPFNRYETVELLLMRLGYLTEVDARTEVGEWEGKPERTLVVRFESSHKLSYLIKMVEDLAGMTNQDAIAIKGVTYGLLVYRAGFTGKEMAYDNEFFIPFTKA